MWETFLQWDHSIFLWINHWQFPGWFSEFFATLTNVHKTSVFQFLVLPLLLAVWFWKKRTDVFRVLVALALTVGLVDSICYWGIKQATFRNRPNHIESLDSRLRVGYGPKSSSFPSNHAANTLAMMTLLALFYPSLSWCFYLYGAMIGLTRIYVGVHFPSDVLAGSFLGWGIAQALMKGVYLRTRFFSKALTEA